MEWRVKKKICKECGYVGKPKTITKGNIGIELILWLFFLVPGLVYSLWRMSSKYKGCTKCGSSHIIPIDSPLGKDLVK